MAACVSGAEAATEMGDGLAAVTAFVEDVGANGKRIDFVVAAIGCEEFGGLVRGPFHFGIPLCGVAALEKLL